MDNLPPSFPANEGKRIGEVWFDPCARIPELLVKYIFASEKLSIQVHPSDEQTQREGIGKQGKEECWLVIDAEPGAALGIGFSEKVEADDLRKAALDGSIERMMVWHEVKPGDFFYIPANTVHAIGGGVSLVEIQQTSDITYRLYDYGRPRELHLDKGIEVADAGPYPDTMQTRLPDSGLSRLVEGPHFNLTWLKGGWTADFAVPERYLLVPLAGRYRVGADVAEPGQCLSLQGPGVVPETDSCTCLVAEPLATA